MTERDEDIRRQAWVEADTHAIERNTRLMRQIVGAGVALIGVVKADGYGHGAAHAARAMLAGGATMLAVSSVGEGRELRAAGISAPMLVLGYTPPERIGAALRDDLALACGDAATLHTAAQLGRAAGRPIVLHLKVDTGMHRLGLLPHEVGAFLDAAQHVEGVRWAGLFTHFATADEPARPQTSAQLTRFNTVRATATALGWHFPLVHAANSAAALAFPAARYDAVRPGIALYGIAPSAEVPLPYGFRPALTFCTRIVRVAALPARALVSYGGTYATPGPRRIATITAGYADGLRRAPAWHAVLVRGERAPIVGRICMDYAMVDVSDIPDAAMGDEVVLLGTQGSATISADEVAAWLGTSPYEVLATLAPASKKVKNEAMQR